MVLQIKSYGIDNYAHLIFQVQAKQKCQRCVITGKLDLRKSRMLAADTVLPYTVAGTELSRNSEKSKNLQR